MNRITRTFSFEAVLWAAWLGFAVQLPAQPGTNSLSVGEDRQAMAKGLRMNYGPFLSYTINAKTLNSTETDNLAVKGIAIKLGGANEAAVCFDTDLLRFAAGWAGGFLDLTKTHLTSYKGSESAFIQGERKFRTRTLPGWTMGNSFRDPRAQPSGPLPADWAKYQGLFRHGGQVVLAYTVGATEVHELPGFEATQGLQAFTRTIRIAPTDRNLTLLVCDWEGGSENMAARREGNPEAAWSDLVVTPSGTQFFAVSTLHAPSAARLKVMDGHLELQLPALPTGALFKIVLMTGPRIETWRNQCASWLLTAPPPIDPRSLCQGGPAQWPEPVTAKGKLGIGGAYVVDTLTAPEVNPWNSWLRFVAFDFFSDGRAAISTWNGDVWIVSGIDGKLERLTWKRFAAGLFEPLGLRIVEDRIYALGRDQITRLHDLNGDGEADFYENFNNDASVAPNYHAFAYELHTDREGNFYYTRTGHRADPDLPGNGCVLKVSKDGRRTEVFATGLRAPNGMSIGPNDEITCSDNQGNWVPSSRLNLVKRGGFYGYVPHSGRPLPPADYDPPICWLPMSIDNSSGGQAWVTSPAWGPFHGQLLHTSYGKCSLFLAMTEVVSGQVQGGVVQFPLRFDSGIMRARFHPRDGQLYVCGLKGWTTSAIRDGTFQRVRYTGQPARMPRALHIHRNGVQIAFTDSLDAESAADEQNYAVEQWNYRWTEKYGSPDFSVANPDQPGRDPVTIKSVQLSADRKSVFLEMAGVKPVMQMRIQFRIQADGGAPIRYEIFNTINRVGSALEK